MDKEPAHRGQGRSNDQPCASQHRPSQDRMVAQFHGGERSVTGAEAILRILERLSLQAGAQVPTPSTTAVTCAPLTPIKEEA